MCSSDLYCVVAHWHIAGAGSSLRDADHPWDLCGLYRGMAGGSVDHGSVHGLGDAAAVSPGRCELRETGPGADRYNPVAVRLHGGSDSRWPAGYSQGAV